MSIGKVLGYEQITSLSSAAGLTVAGGATTAIVAPQTQNVRWRDDGTDPTATVGMLLEVGKSLRYAGDLNKIKFIETTASAALNVSYYYVSGEDGFDVSGSGPATAGTGTSATQVQGTAASGATAVGNPVLIGGLQSANVQTIAASADNADAVATGNGRLVSLARLTAYNGATWDRMRGTTNGLQIIGAAADDAAKAGAPVLTGGVYNTIANQSTLDTGDAGEFQVDVAGNLKTTTGAPAATDILAGYLQHTATTGAATLVTIPAGKTFVGTLTVSVAASKAAASTGNGLVSAVIATAGTNVTPAAATIFVVSARVGANAATGTVGTQGSNTGSIPVIVNAPAGNSATLTLASTLTNTSEGAVDASVFGRIQ